MYCYKGLKYCTNITWKRKKGGHKHKNNGSKVLILPRNVEKQYHENLLLDFLLKYEVSFPV